MEQGTPGKHQMQYSTKKIQQNSAQCRNTAIQCKTQRRGRDRLNPWIQAANDMRKNTTWVLGLTKGLPKTYQRVTGLRSLVYLGVARIIYHIMDPLDTLLQHISNYFLLSKKLSSSAQSCQPAVPISSFEEKCSACPAFLSQSQEEKCLAFPSQHPQFLLPAQLARCPIRQRTLKTFSAPCSAVQCSAVGQESNLQVDGMTVAETKLHVLLSASNHLLLLPTLPPPNNQTTLHCKIAPLLQKTNYCTACIYNHTSPQHIATDCTAQKVD